MRSRQISVMASGVPRKRDGLGFEGPGGEAEALGGEVRGRSVTVGGVVQIVSLCRPWRRRPCRRSVLYLACVVTSTSGVLVSGAIGMRSRVTS